MVLKKNIDFFNQTTSSNSSDPDETDPSVSNPPVIGVIQQEVRTLVNQKYLIPFD
jgi:hypothetical protein